MPFPTHLILRAAACLSALFLVAGCSSSDSRAQAALTAYQAAAAANDLAGARKALLQLVQAKDDVADYWVELGKLQASTGDVNDAYYAFTRVYELDRGNAGILRQERSASRPHRSSRRGASNTLVRSCTARRSAG